jgi:biopolymer transport protein ExbB
MIEFLRLGGPVVWILLLLSLVAASIGMLKVWQFWRNRSVGGACPDRALAEWQQGSISQLKLMVNGQRNPRARLIAHIVKVWSDGGLTPDQLRNEALRYARELIAETASYLRPLEVIATLAPLLGLFGTVIGMIDAFKAMEMAGAQVNPSVLSGGIWVALLTTAVGLAVAMPATVMHSWLDRYVEKQASQLQSDFEYMLTIDAQRPITKHKAVS